MPYNHDNYTGINREDRDRLNATLRERAEKARPELRARMERDYPVGRRIRLSDRVMHYMSTKWDAQARQTVTIPSGSIGTIVEPLNDSWCVAVRYDDHQDLLVIEEPRGLDLIPVDMDVSYSVQSVATQKGYIVINNCDTEDAAEQRAVEMRKTHGNAEIIRHEILEVE
ncbi:hypothetical protein [Oceanidesulfovibrio marinus]|uniref:Uncharacterized protein n=1 Tax=Oceanidesulfovibrio marinus TaxID=370038 RepID=A0A6P1ZCW3_9BACT|nr:hypothetical protein [Oceanidesulfovibrio marinus]TVM31192.1 hypothetical protein DQK91_18960 [Oceanidesulfovibrio marinus]